jgi:hypothetical protein
MYVGGKRFATDADVNQAVTSWLQTLDTNSFHVGIQTFVPRTDECLNINGGYVEVSRVSSDAHVSCMLHIHVRLNVCASGRVWPYLFETSYPYERFKTFVSVLATLHANFFSF